MLSKNLNLFCIIEFDDLPFEQYFQVRTQPDCKDFVLSIERHKFPVIEKTDFDVHGFFISYFFIF